MGDKIEKNEIGEECSAYVLEESHIQVLVGNPEGKITLGRPRLRWEYNIKIDIQEVGCGVTDWIEQADDRDIWRVLVNVAINLRVP